MSTKEKLTRTWHGRPVDIEVKYNERSAILPHSVSGLRVTVDLTMEVEGCKFGAYCFNDNCSGLSEYHQIREELITQAFERLEKNIEWFASEKYMQLTREEVARTLAGAEQQYNVAKWLQDFKKNQ